MISNFFKALSILFPWFLRRRLLNHLFGYEIHSSARIGLSWIFPDKLVMGPFSQIGHFNVAINLSKIAMGPMASIARSNWITGFPLKSKSLHFKHKIDRKPELIMGCSSAITKNHHIDCTDLVEIGDFAIIAGYASQFLTHSIDIKENRQDCAPIIIGRYSFVGTNVVILSGAALPANSVLGAKSLLNKFLIEEYILYAGVPAVPVSSLTPTSKYFSRQTGFVV